MGAGALGAGAASPAVGVTSGALGAAMAATEAGRAATEAGATGGALEPRSSRSSRSSGSMREDAMAAGAVVVGVPERSSRSSRSSGSIRADAMAVAGVAVAGVGTETEAAFGSVAATEVVGGAVGAAVGGASISSRSSGSSASPPAAAGAALVGPAGAAAAAASSRPPSAGPSTSTKRASSSAAATRSWFSSGRGGLAINRRAILMDSSGMPYLRAISSASPSVSCVSISLSSSLRGTRRTSCPVRNSAPMPSKATSAGSFTDSSSPATGDPRLPEMKNSCPVREMEKCSLPTRGPAAEKSPRSS